MGQACQKIKGAVEEGSVKDESSIIETISTCGSQLEKQNEQLTKRVT